MAAVERGLVVPGHQVLWGEGRKRGQVFSQLEDQQCHTILCLAGENLPWLSNCCP